MALSVSVSLIGVYSPRTVQIVLTGLTPGQSYSVEGSWSGGSWPVRAGTGTAADSHLVLSDIATPINVPVTYRVMHAGVELVSDPVTVGYPYGAVLQSLSGAGSVPLVLKDNRAPLDLEMRQATFKIPGRPRPVVRYDIAAGESGELLAATDGADTQTLKELLKAGGILLMRSDGEVAADLDAVAYLLITAAPSSLLVGTSRRWRLSYRVLDDPEPDTLTGLPTWDDFDAAYAGLTWDDFDAEFSGLTWDDFDVSDWATRAAT